MLVCLVVVVLQALCVPAMHVPGRASASADGSSTLAGAGGQAGRRLAGTRSHNIPPLFTSPGYADLIKCNFHCPRPVPSTRVTGPRIVYKCEACDKITADRLADCSEVCGFAADIRP